MPLPMVHLLLAHMIGEKTKCENEGYFILGSIAPDSIHMRKGSNRVDKHKTHMFINGYGDRDSIAGNFALIKNALKRAEKAGYEEQQFVKGYCIHTMLDIFWINKIFNVLAGTLRAGAINFEEIRTVYYRETNFCDAEIYRGEEWVPRYRKTLEDIVPMGFEGLLSSEEVGLWRNEVIKKMERYENYDGPASHYITYKRILDFTENFSYMVIEKFGELGYSL